MEEIDGLRWTGLVSLAAFKAVNKGVGGRNGNV